MNKTTELLQGTLDLLILKAISLGPLHGYGVLLRLQQLSRDTLQIPQGSLYPALYRLERRGLIEADWGVSELGRKAKFYRITPKGRRQLAADTQEWTRFSAAVSKVLTPSGA